MIDKRGSLSADLLAKSCLAAYPRASERVGCQGARGRARADDPARFRGRRSVRQGSRLRRRIPAVLLVLSRAPRVAASAGTPAIDQARPREQATGICRCCGGAVVAATAEPDRHAGHPARSCCRRGLVIHMQPTSKPAPAPQMQAAAQPPSPPPLPQHDAAPPEPKLAVIAPPPAAPPETPSVAAAPPSPVAPAVPPAIAPVATAAPAQANATPPQTARCRGGRPHSLR